MMQPYYIYKINEHYKVFKGTPKSENDFIVKSLNKTFNELEKIVKEEFDKGNKPMLYMKKEDNKYERIKFTELIKRYHVTRKKD